MAKVIVFGANGFIGSHLVEALVRCGHEVSAFDRFSSSEPRFATDGVRLFRGDFFSKSDVEHAVMGQDFVFHFLWSTSPLTAQSDPTLDIRTNVITTVELLEICVKSNVKHFYFASTGGAVYGPQNRKEFSEKDLTLPVSPYAIGKLTIENYLRYFGAVHGLQSTTLRISNPYGPRQKVHKRQGLIPISLRQILLNEPVVRYGDGEMVRDYIYIDDLITMISTLVEKPHQFSTYNLGSGLGYSVNEVLDTIRSSVDSNFILTEEPKPLSFVEHVILDISRYSGEFGVFSQTNLGDGIQRTFESMKRDIPNSIS